MMLGELTGASSPRLSMMLILWERLRTEGLLSALLSRLFLALALFFGRSEFALVPFSLQALSFSARMLRLFFSTFPFHLFLSCQFLFLYALPLHFFLASAF